MTILDSDNSAAKLVTSMYPATADYYICEDFDSIFFEIILKTYPFMMEENQLVFSSFSLISVLTRDVKSTLQQATLHVRFLII